MTCQNARVLITGSVIPSLSSFHSWFQFCVSSLSPHHCLVFHHFMLTSLIALVSTFMNMLSLHLNTVTRQRLSELIIMKYVLPPFRHNGLVCIDGSFWGCSQMTCKYRLYRCCCNAFVSELSFAYFCIFYHHLLTYMSFQNGLIVFPS